jgi:hypothetical protein
MSLFSRIWASGGTKTAYTDEKITQGFVRKDKPVWHKLNWLFNRIESNISAVQKAFLRNLRYMTGTTSTTDTGGIVYMKDRELLYQKKGTTVFSQDNDGTWSSVGTTTATPGIDFIAARNHTHVMFNGESGKLECWANSAVGTKVTETVNGLAEIRGKVSKYVDGGSDDFLIMGDSGGNTRYSTAGIGGTWTTPTTDIAETVAVKSMVWLGGSVFLAACNNKIYVTLDDGDNWSARYTHAATEIPSRLAVDDSGTVMSMSKDSGTGSILLKTSDDAGLTWSTVKTLTGSTQGDLINLNNETWMVSGVIADSYSTRESPAIISADNGATWEDCFDMDGGFFGADVFNMATDGNRVFIQITSNKTIQSLAL